MAKRRALRLGGRIGAQCDHGDQSGGVIEMVNARAERLFGYGRAELFGRPVEMLVPERFRGGHPGVRRSFFAAPRSRPMGGGRDLYASRNDGGEFPVEIGLNPIETDEGTMVPSAIVDISERKQNQARVDYSPNEKDALLGEIHHPVKNNLQIADSLLELRLPRISAPAVISSFKDGQNRIRSMALIHQTLCQSEDFAQVDFSTFLDTLVPSLPSSDGIEPSRISLAIDTVDVPLPIKVAVPCALMVNELITNAFTHAFLDGRSGQITVSLRHENGERVTLSVADDGVGIPAALDIEKAESLGLQLVTLLTEQLGAELGDRARQSDPVRAAPADPWLGSNRAWQR